MKCALAAFALAFALLCVSSAEARSSRGYQRSNVSQGFGSGGGWQGYSPRWIAGLQVYVTAVSGVTGSPVSAWADQSGNGQNFTATGTQQPAYNSAPLNGRPTLTFNGSTNRMTGANNLAIGAPSSFFAVVVPRTIDASIHGFMVSKQLAVYTSLSSSKWGTSISAALIDDVLTVGKAYALGVVIRAVNDVDLVENGAISNQTAGSAFASRSAMSIAADPSGVQFGNFDLAEMVIVNRALDAGDIFRLRVWLSTQWGVF